jgi:hypothetical protein
MLREPRRMPERLGDQLFPKKNPDRGAGADYSEMERLRYALFERLRLHRLLVMPKAASKSDRRHGDDDCNGEKSAHR